MRTGFPEIKLGDLVKVTLKNDSKVFELVDIAVWQDAKTIKTIDIIELKLPYDPSKRDKKIYKNKLSKTKIKLKHHDRIIIKTKTDSKVYQVFVSHEYQNESKIGKVFFTKLMNPFCRCN